MVDKILWVFVAKGVEYCTHFCLHGSIQLEKETSLVFFGAFNLFTDFFGIFS